MNESILKKLKMVKPSDIWQLFVFFVAVIPGLIYKLFSPHLWLVCEKRYEARDNGYWFFKYLSEKQPKIDAIYAISKKAGDYGKVKDLGKVVQFGSFKHWIYYIAAEVNVSSQKDGNPNAAVCYLFENILKVFKSNRVFLQHGVAEKDLPFVHYGNAMFMMFCCGAKPEYEFIKNTFGYPEGAVRYTGLCRFDSYDNDEKDDSLIFIAPTWRMKLNRNATEEEFLKSDYYSNWNGLLQSDLGNSLEKNNAHAVFCVHRNMAKFQHLFKSDHPSVQVLNWKDVDINKMIKTAGLFITDYSSIAMDFAFQLKNVIYYQFDLEDFRKNHLPKAYFDYKTDGFGPICENKTELIASINDYLGNRALLGKYEERILKFYELHDNSNCQRTFDAIKETIARKRSR